MVGEGRMVREGIMEGEGMMAGEERMVGEGRTVGEEEGEGKRNRPKKLPSSLQCGRGGGGWIPIWWIVIIIQQH